MAVTYEPIATTSLSGVTTYTFSAIPQTYTDLVIIFYGQPSNVSTGSYVCLRFNNDSTNNCYQNAMEGAPSPLTETTASTYMVCNWHGSAFQSSTQFSNYVGHIHSYSNTVNKKTLLGQFNGVSEVAASHGLWTQTSAITSITIFNPQSYTFAAGSVATLYGIKAA